MRLRLARYETEVLISLTRDFLRYVSISKKGNYGNFQEHIISQKSVFHSLKGKRNFRNFVISFFRNLPTSGISLHYHYNFVNKCHSYQKSTPLRDTLISVGAKKYDLVGKKEIFEFKYSQKKSLVVSQQSEIHA